jgi:uncharacterized protein (TIGR00369 family)
MQDHYRKLERMYMSARIQKKYPGIHLTVDKRHAMISLPVDESYHHAGGYMHGSVYFRLLDDVCYFAAMSEELNHFYVTSEFSIQFFRPLKNGIIRAESNEIKWLENEFHVKGTLYNEEGKKLASGSGIFKKSRYQLDESVGYRLD